MEHEEKTSKLKGKKVTPSIVGTLDHRALPLGHYVGLKFKQKISLVNEGGFLNAAPHLRAAYSLANLRPATLGEEAISVSNGEVFVLENSQNSVAISAFKTITHSIKEEELVLLNSIWIPGVFSAYDSTSRGFISLKSKEIILENRKLDLLLSSEIEFESRYKFNSQTLKLYVKGTE
ncbi:hypothetical protein [Saccharibacillus sacchari]|uniref:Uncharacterized protein n=1 Tax=Saccharibacillus sacchari TaxID=456493 RepID=A0ACC6PKH4_9BACL